MTGSGLWGFGVLGLFGKAVENGSKIVNQFYSSEPSSVTRMTKQTGKPHSGLGSRSSSPEKGHSELESAVSGQNKLDSMDSDSVAIPRLED